MKIAYFTDTYKPQINGVITSIDSFAQEMRNNGHEVTVVAPKSPKLKSKHKNIITVASLKFRPYPDYRIAIPLKLKKKDFSDYDIIHVHTPSFLGLSGMRIAHKNKIPLVMTFHTNFSDYAHYVSKGAVVEKVMKKGILKYTKSFFNRADMIVTPTEEIKKQLRKQNIDTPITVIPTGIDITPLKETKKQIREKYNIPLDEKIILHVGRVTKEKNIIMILKAFQLIENNNIKLIITSNGPYKKQLEKYIQENEIKNVIFTGYLSEQKLKEYYKMSDVFVMASETETQGLVILEALAQSLPVVVTDAPVISDFVKENNVGLVSKKNEKSLARTIESSFSGKEFETKETLKKFSSETCAKDMINLYEKMIQ